MNSLAVNLKKFRIIGMFMDSSRFLVDFFGFYRELFGAAYPVVFEDQRARPCALAISTPVSMVSGLTNGARNGVLIKGSNYVEALSKIKTFAFDKTGTLTEGNLVVTDVVGVTTDEESVLRYAASLEVKSEHPVAEAIVKRYTENGDSLLDVVDFQAVTGKGIIGPINGKNVYIGNRTLAKENMAFIPEENVLTLEENGKTVVFVGEGKTRARS